MSIFKNKKPISFCINARGMGFNENIIYNNLSLWKNNSIYVKLLFDSKPYIRVQ